MFGRSSSRKLMSGRITSTPGLRLAAEGDAHVDDEPLAVVGRAIAVEIEVHADLAHAAKRHEHELWPLSVGTSGHALD